MAFSARIDLASAYPLVTRSRIRQALQGQLNRARGLRQDGELRRPWRGILNQVGVAEELCDAFAGMLDGVEYSHDVGYDRMAWILKNDKDGWKKILEKDLTIAARDRGFGLPTGLAVSGLLSIRFRSLGR
jgi:hypothetical protein